MSVGVLKNVIDHSIENGVSFSSVRKSCSPPAHIVTISPSMPDISALPASNPMVASTLYGRLWASRRGTADCLNRCSLGAVCMVVGSIRGVSPRKVSVSRNLKAASHSAWIGVTGRSVRWRGSEFSTKGGLEDADRNATSSGGVRV